MRPAMGCIFSRAGRPDRDLLADRTNGGRQQGTNSNQLDHVNDYDKVRVSSNANTAAHAKVNGDKGRQSLTLAELRSALMISKQCLGKQNEATNCLPGAQTLRRAQGQSLFAKLTQVGRPSHQSVKIDTCFQRHQKYPFEAGKCGTVSDLERPTSSDPNHQEHKKKNNKRKRRSSISAAKFANSIEGENNFRFQGQQVSSSSTIRATERKRKPAPMPQNPPIDLGSSKQLGGTNKGDKLQVANLDLNANGKLNQKSTGEPVNESSQISPGKVEDEVRLFTSIEQLCLEIINKNPLLINGPPKANNLNNSDKCLCLFMFGCPGSGKGEIAFELVEHSPLLKFLNSNSNSNSNSNFKDKRDEEKENSAAPLPCPLYHHLDVAAIIVANIDARIREYHQLEQQTSRIRRQQLALISGSLERDEFSDNQSGDRSLLSADDEEIKQELIGEPKQLVPPDEREASISLETLSVRDSDSQESNECSIRKPSSSSSSGNQLKVSREERDKLAQVIPRISEDFGPITLTTKQRSILQLKLMQYFNSITSKWVFGLIRDEVNKLELNYEKMVANFSEKKLGVAVKGQARERRNRVYLISLVPNQLTLFKSCLYLQQNLQLNDFKHPFFAIKFERRTNIKLLTKERATENSQGESVSKIPIRLKLPALHLSSAQPAIDFGQKVRENGASISENKTESTLIDAIAGRLVEKLGPKMNENFAQQFKLMNKLIQVRYNPIRDYNYAQLEDIQSMGLISNNDDADELRHSKQLQGVVNCETNSKIEAQVFCPANNADRSIGMRPMLNDDDDQQNLVGSEANMANTVGRIYSSSMQNLSSPAAGDNEGPDFGHHYRAATLSASTSSPNYGRGSSAGQLRLSPSICSLSSQSVADDQLTSGGSSNSVKSRPQVATNWHSESTSSKVNSPHSDRIKRSIELELFDSSASESQVQSGWRASPASLSRPTGEQVGELDEGDSSKQHSVRAGGQGPKQVVFYEPKLARSPLMFTSGHHRRIISSNGDNNYKLIPIRVAYANGRSQVMFEARKVHSRSLKLKSANDLARLIKLASKLKRKLAQDCDRWLDEAVANYCRTLGSGSSSAANLAADHQIGSMSASNSLASISADECKDSALHQRKRHSISTWSAQGQHEQVEQPKLDTMSPLIGHSLASSCAHQNAMPTLIVYTIRVDIGRIKWSQFQSLGNQSQIAAPLNQPDSPADRLAGCQLGASRESDPPQPQQVHPPVPLHPIIVPILTLNEQSNLETLHSGRGGNLRPASGSRVRPNSSQPRRHVKFKLSETNWRNDPNSYLDDPVINFKFQRRQWIESDLFVSSEMSAADEETLNLTASLVRSMLRPANSSSRD